MAISVHPEAFPMFFLFISPLQGVIDDTLTWSLGTNANKLASNMVFVD